MKQTPQAAGHTPGPYHIDEMAHIDADNLPAAWIAVADHDPNEDGGLGAVVCYCHKQNAPLFASAPALFAALERLFACPDLHLDDKENETIEAMYQADRALALARGTSAAVPVEGKRASLRCPCCGSSADIRECPEWESRSLDSTDRNNTARLVEYQCHAGNCGGKSFWVGSPSAEPLPADPRDAEIARLRLALEACDEMLGEYIRTAGTNDQADAADLVQRQARAALAGSGVQS